MTPLLDRKAVTDAMAPKTSAQDAITQQNGLYINDLGAVQAQHASTLVAHGGYINDLSVLTTSHNQRLGQHDNTLADHGGYINNFGTRLAAIEAAGWVARFRIENGAINAIKVATESLDGSLFVSNSIGTRPLNMTQLYADLDGRYVRK